MPDPGESLAFTGERFIPGTPGEIWYEHWHRYHFAAPLVARQRVLDVACGEGYGAALLARTAAHVTGVDVSPDAIAHARRTYGARGNIRFQPGDCTALPFPDATFDVVVSFETLEHLAEQERFLDEVRRVLTPPGLLVISSPNRPRYSEARGVTNPFHVRELDRDELAAVLLPRFPCLRWYGQHVSFFSVIADEQPASGGSLFAVSSDAPDAARPAVGQPRYFLVLAGADSAAVAGATSALSVLADADELVYRDYEKVTRELHLAHERGNALEARVSLLDAHHAEAVRQRDAIAAERDALAAACAALRERCDRVLSESAASVQSHLAWQAKLEADVAELRSEVRQRESWRWWWRSLRRRVGSAFR